MPNLTADQLEKLVRKANESILFESSYNRVRKHIQEGNAFVMITSDRHERSAAANKALYKELKASYKHAGFPFTELKGGFKETTKVVRDPETGEETQVGLDEPIHVTENTILVTDHERGDKERETAHAARDLFNLTTRLAQLYGQEAFIYGEEATTPTGRTFKDIRAYDDHGRPIGESWAGPWSSVTTVERDEDFWSRIKGKHFQLKEEAPKTKTSQPKSWIEAVRKSKSGMTW